MIQYCVLCALWYSICVRSSVYLMHMENSDTLHSPHVFSIVWKLYLCLSRHLGQGHTCYKLSMHTTYLKSSCTFDTFLCWDPMTWMQVRLSHFIPCFSLCLCMVHFVHRPDIYCLIVGHLERVEFSPLFFLLSP